MRRQIRLPQLLLAHDLTNFGVVGVESGRQGGDAPGRTSGGTGPRGGCPLAVAAGVEVLGRIQPPHPGVGHVGQSLLAIVRPVLLQPCVDVLLLPNQEPLMTLIEGLWHNTHLLCTACL